MPVFGIVRINHSIYLPRTIPVSRVYASTNAILMQCVIIKPPSPAAQFFGCKSNVVYAGTVANHEQKSGAVITIRVCVCVCLCLCVCAIDLGSMGMACGGGAYVFVQGSSWRRVAEPCFVPTRPMNCCRRPARKDPTLDAGSAQPYVLRYARPQPPFRPWLACSTWKRTFRFSGVAPHVCPSRR